MTYFIRPQPTVEELQRVISQLARHRYIVLPPNGRAYIDTSSLQPGDTIIYDRKQHGEDGRLR